MGIILLTSIDASGEYSNQYDSSFLYDAIIMHYSFSAMMENSLLLEVRISVYISGRLIMTVQSFHQLEEIEMNFGKE